MSRHTAARPFFFVFAFFTSVVAIAAGPSPKPGDPLYPDIVEQISHMQMQHAQGTDTLRFSTTHINIGEGPLQISGGGHIAPCDIDGVHYDQCTIATQEILDVTGKIVQTHPAGVAFFHPQHNHWHQSAVALFEVRMGSPNGPAVASGKKITFCLVDNDRTILVKKGSSRGYFECNAELQGISVGWSDDYHQSTEGQELDMTRAPAGDYWLVHLADPEGHWLETNKDNNFACVKFTFTRSGGNPKVYVLDQKMSGCPPPTPYGSKSNP